MMIILQGEQDELQENPVRALCI